MKTFRLISRTLLPALALLAATSTAWAAAYRWTDPSGNVVYGDQPPTGADAQRMQAPPPPPLVEPATEPTAQSATPGEIQVEPAGQPIDMSVVEGETPDQIKAREEALRVEQERQRVMQENAQIERRNAEIKKANCQGARNNLEMLQRNRPVRIEQGDGNRAKRYSAEERQAAIREAQKQVRENCN